MPPALFTAGFSPTGNGEQLYALGWAPGRAASRLVSVRSRLVRAVRRACRVLAAVSLARCFCHPPRRNVVSEMRAPALHVSVWRGRAMVMPERSRPGAAADLTVSGSGLRAARAGLSVTIIVRRSLRAMLILCDYHGKSNSNIALRVKSKCQNCFAVIRHGGSPVALPHDA